MKKYKLIKSYPGSPEVGTEVEVAGPYIQVSGCLYVDLGSLDNYPEFWQLVKTKKRGFINIYKCSSVIGATCGARIFDTTAQAKEFAMGSTLVLVDTIPIEWEE